MIKNPILKILDNLFIHGFELFGRYYSCYRGFVVDNNDKEGYARIKLSVPQVYGSEFMEEWAWPRGNFAGPGYGSQCIPQVRDMVWVEFEQGDPRKPIWSHGHFGRKPDGSKEKPSELLDIGNFWFKTPGGHLIEFDDTNKEIRITDIGGNHIKISGGLLQLNGKAEPSVLGDTLEVTLEEICDIINSLSDAVGLLTVPTAFGPSGVPLNLADFSVISQAIVNLKITIKNIKSKLVVLS